MACVPQRPRNLRQNQYNSKSDTLSLRVNEAMVGGSPSRKNRMSCLPQLWRYLYNQYNRKLDILALRVNEAVGGGSLSWLSRALSSATVLWSLYCSSNWPSHIPPPKLRRDLRSLAILHREYSLPDGHELICPNANTTHTIATRIGIAVEVRREWSRPNKPEKYRRGAMNGVQKEMVWMSNYTKTPRSALNTVPPRFTPKASALCSRPLTH